MSEDQSAGYLVTVRSCKANFWKHQLPAILFDLKRRKEKKKSVSTP
jgi:hypothetical protein